jgi:abhydrolase domain-containing protein 4
MKDDYLEFLYLLQGSSRPKFSSDPIVAENEFIDAIEEWRQQVGLTSMILMGHSFGGYLSTSYALKYPQHVKALILIDTWGFAESKLAHQIPMLYRFFLFYISPTGILRLLGKIGIYLYKRIIPEVGQRFKAIVGDSDVMYDYAYHSNKNTPRLDDDNDDFDMICLIYLFCS